QVEAMDQDFFNLDCVGAGKLGADAVLHPAASRIEQLGAVQKLHRGRRSPGAADALPIDVVNKLLSRLHAASSVGQMPRSHSAFYCKNSTARKETATIWT